MNQIRNLVFLAGDQLNIKFLEACKNFNQDKIGYDELISMTEKHGFNYVLERFHIINGETT